MKTLKIPVHVPEEALFSLGFSQERTSRRMLELLPPKSVDLFHQDQITCEKAATLLEIGQ